MARVAVGSVSLAVAEWPGPAKGPAIVCIHGLTANHTCWASVADVLSPAHRLIAYDLRGHGESAKPADPSFYNEGRRWADEVAE